MNFSPDDPKSEVALDALSSVAQPNEVAPAEQPAASPLMLSEVAVAPVSTTADAVPRDPVWGALDVVLLAVVGLAAIFFGVLTTLVAARFGLYRHLPLNDLIRMPLIGIVGQALGYLIILLYMYLVVTRHYRRPDFLAAIHWNQPVGVLPYLFAGLVLSVGLQALAHLLPMPRNLPIDMLFRTPAEAWTLAIFSVTLAPLMEELVFRGFLYPVLERGIGMSAGIVVTGAAFALLHGSQLRFSWGPVLVILLVGLALTYVRAKKNSVAASLLIHVGYNGTIGVLMFVTTDGFRHLEKLGSQ